MRVGAREEAQRRKLGAYPCHLARQGDQGPAVGTPGACRCLQPRLQEGNRGLGPSRAPGCFDGFLLLLLARAGVSRVGSGSCADGARGGGCRLLAPQRQIQAPTSLLLPVAESLPRGVGLAGRKQGCWLGPPPHPRGWRRSRRGLPSARLPPTEAIWCWSSGGCFLNLPAWPPQPSTASLAKPEGLQTGPVLPGFPRPQSLGQRNGSLGRAPPHPDCDPSLR